MKEVPKGLLEEITGRLVAEFDPEAIDLFGSHAWEEPTEDSDLDILVVVAWDASPPRTSSLRRSGRQRDALPAPRGSPPLSDRRL